MNKKSPNILFPKSPSHRLTSRKIFYIKFSVTTFKFKPNKHDTWILTFFYNSGYDFSTKSISVRKKNNAPKWFQIKQAFLLLQTAFSHVLNRLYLFSFFSQGCDFLNVLFFYFYLCFWIVLNAHASRDRKN